MSPKGVSLGRKWIASLAGAAFAVALPMIALAEESPGEVDPKMRREVEMAEERLGRAIENRDATGLADMLADYFSASVGDAERAATKQRVIAQAKAGRLIFYRMEREVRLRVSAGHYDRAGEAKSPPREISDKPVEIKWVRVRRVWLKKDGRWLLILQHVSEREDDEEAERKEK
jgi:hypothetical protein